MSESDWNETVELGGGADLIDRWLAEDSLYRQAMAGIDEELLLQLRPLMKSLNGKGIRMPMRHKLLSGRWAQKNPGETGV